ncbi:MAG: PLP-dependent aminotransferase family protein [Alphaproteobacteria bacterium]
MTIWFAELTGGDRTKSRSLADAIAAAIADGRLRSGERLPPQRELAWKLGISLGTVTRAYDEARRCGLLEGRVGSGTFVREQGPATAGFVISGDRPDQLIDLALDVYATPLWTGPLSATLAALAAEDSSSLLEYQAADGMARHRGAAAAWFGRREFAPAPEDIVLTTGGQHALAVAFSALTRPGDGVLVESFCYPPVRALAEIYGLGLRGVALDAEGMIPDALDAACRTRPARLLYLTPTLQNPTNAVMAAARRAEIAEVAARHDLMVIEDDVTGALLPESPAPLATLIPERCCFVSSLSKTVVPGLRTGIIVPPEPWREQILARVRALGWMSPPLNWEIVTRWIEDGTAVRLREGIRHENAERHALAASLLPGLEESPASAVSPHVWYRLPGDWHSSAFVEAAQARGVRIAPTRSFSIQDSPADAVRISVSAARSRKVLCVALEILGELARSPEPRRAAEIL